MKKIIVLMSLAGLIFGALNIHLIWTDSGPKVLPKSSMSFEYTFVDASGINKYKLVTNPVLIKAGIRELLK